MPCAAEELHLLSSVVRLHFKCLSFNFTGWVSDTQ